MVSRDAKLQVGALLVGFGLLLVWASLDGGFAADQAGLSPVDLVFGLGWTFVILAGAHVYRAARGEGGSLPVDARWRFVGVVAASLALLAVAAALTSLDPIVGIRPELPVLATLGALLVGWFLFEAREGYLESGGHSG